MISHFVFFSPVESFYSPTDRKTKKLTDKDSTHCLHLFWHFLLSSMWKLFQIYDILEQHFTLLYWLHSPNVTQTFQAQDEKWKILSSNQLFIHLKENPILDKMSRLLPRNILHFFNMWSQCATKSGISDWNICSRFFQHPVS